MPKSRTKKSEPTTSDVLNAVNTFATHVEERFQQIDEKIDKTRIELVAENTETRKELAQEIHRLDWKMVTKDH